MEEPETKNDTSSIFPDWSQLPKELLHLISTHLEDNCFGVVHARSVCSSWRSTFPFPSFLLRPSYSLPSLAEYPSESRDLCTIEKVPLFLFGVRAPNADADAAEYFLGEIGRDESADHIELPSPLQCLVKVEMLGSDPTLLNMLDYHILSLGHRYRLVGCKLQDYRDLAFLQLNKGGEFVVLLTYSELLLVLTSAEMRWKRIENVPDYALALVTFRGRFYAGFLSGEIVVIDPHSLEVTPLMPPSGPAPYLVPSGNDELFLVEVTLPTIGREDINQLTCRVSRLEEEAGKWVEVSDLGNRVLFITVMGNVSCLAKELPHGCGLSGQSRGHVNKFETLAYGLLP